MTYIKFENEQERLSHPHLRLIPKHVWYNDLNSVSQAPHFLSFKQKFPVQWLPILEANDLASAYSKIDHNRNEQEVSLQWICLLVKFPLLTSYDLKSVSQISNNVPNTIMVICATLGDDKLIRHLYDLADYSKRAKWEKESSRAFLISCAVGNTYTFGNTYMTNWLFYHNSSNSFQKTLLRSYHYEGFQLACYRGHLSIAKMLLNWADTDEVKATMIQSRDWRSLIMACMGGHQEVAQWLLSHLDSDQQRTETIINYGHSCLTAACQAGHQPIAEWLLSHIESNDEKTILIKKNYHEVFRSACKGGHHAIASWLQNHYSIQKTYGNFFEAVICDAFKNACLGGHQTMAQWLLSLLDTQDQKASIIQDDNYWVFNEACLGGHEHIAKWLLSQIDTKEQRQAMIKGKYFEPFVKACEGGHTKMALWLLTLATNNDEEMNLYVSAFTEAFLHSCAGGHLETARWLLRLSNMGINIAKTIQPDITSAFTAACSNGQLKTANWLFSLADVFGERRSIIEAITHKTFSDSCFHGQEAIAHWLHEVAVTMRIELEMLRSDNYGAFENACLTGRLNIAQWLLSLTASEHERSAMLDFAHLDLSIIYRNRNYEMFIWLIEESTALFAQAESDNYFDDSLLESYLLRTVRDIPLSHVNLTRHQQNEFFDIEDSPHAIRIYYILRWFIRSNNRAHDNDIAFLLNIPAIKFMAQQTIDDNGANELYALAISVGNHHAVNQLLHIHEINQLVSQNTTRMTQTLDMPRLTNLTDNPESSMVSLSASESDMLRVIKNHYSPTIQRVNTANVLNQLRDYLVDQYRHNPAIVQTDNQTVTLPLEYNNFQALNFTGRTLKKANEAYYQHPYHTAWRYLSKPNRWIHPQASYVEVDPNNYQQRWAMFVTHQDLIAQLFLAAKDVNPAMKPTDKTITVADRVALFVNELAQIARAHNWDKSKLIDNRSQEYDDLEADRPSCSVGVKRRLFQSLLYHPLTTVISRDIVNQALTEELYRHFDNLISDHNAPQIKEILDDCVINFNYDRIAVLKQYDLNNDQQATLTGNLQDRFGTVFNEFRPYILNRLKLATEQSAHLIEFYTIVGIESLLEKHIVHDTTVTRIDNTTERSIFDINPSVEYRQNKKRPFYNASGNIGFFATSGTGVIVGSALLTSLITTSVISLGASLGIGLGIMALGIVIGLIIKAAQIYQSNSTKSQTTLDSVS